VRASLWQTDITRLFATARREGDSVNTARLRAIVQQHIQDRLSEWESGLYENGKAEKLSQNSEAWTDALSTFSDFTVDDLKDALRRNDLASVENDADTLIARHQIDVVKGTALYRSLCRELLIAEQRIAKAVSKRVQGEYTDEAALVSASTAVAVTLPQVPHGVAPAPTPGCPMVFQEAMSAYLKHYEGRAPGTIREKTGILIRFS
jgi:hypothetical protein